MKPMLDVGLVGHGAYVPRFRLPATEVGRVWNGGPHSAPIREKSVPGLDEDVATMAIEIARGALRRAKVSPYEVGAVWIGSESHPYAVKPTGTIVAEAVGAVPATLAADMQFACKAGTEALQAAFGLVGSGMVRYALAIGADTAQAAPADALEYTAGAGGAGFVVGPAEESVAVLEGSVSLVTDTPDFWRRQHARYPMHAGRFTGDPAYFGHLVEAVRRLLEELGTSAGDYAHVVFHQPNQKFPQRAAKKLGFSPAQMQAGLLVNEIGNTYAGASLLGLASVLDVAEPGQRVLVASFGSGAGSDAFGFRVSRAASHDGLRTTRDFIERRVELDYAMYARYRGKVARTA